MSTLNSRADDPAPAAAPARTGDWRPEPILADRAVFTSIRSATGSGYRIIAASAGLRAEEKQDITQQSPSHASLCDEAENAEALAAYPLRTGRYCVARSRHAGLEPSARGGFRVYTDALVLSEAAYARFGRHPARVLTAMLSALDDEPLLKPPPALEPIELPDPAASASTWLSALGIGCRAELIFQAAALLMDGRSVIVINAPSPVAVLDGAIAVVPAGMRAGLNAVCGLKFSPARQARLMLLNGPVDQARQLTRGRPIDWLDGTAPGSPAVENAWIRLGLKWWTTGKRRDFCFLAGKVDFPATPEALNRIAGLGEELDRIATADVPMLRQICARCTDTVPANPLERELLNRLLGAAQRRLQTP